MLRNGIVRAIVLLGLAVVSSIAVAQLPLPLAQPESWDRFWGWLNSLNSGDLFKHEQFLALQMSKAAQRQHSASELAVKQIDILNQAGGGFIVNKTLEMSDTEMHVILKGRDGVTLADADVRLMPDWPFSITTIKLRLSSSPPEAEAVPILSAPEVLSPEHGGVFGHFPRTTTLRWNPVPFAASYRVQWDYRDDRGWASEHRNFRWPSFKALETSYTFNFVGAQPGRWRVWAVDIYGNPGAKSEWHEFRYTQ